MTAAAPATRPAHADEQSRIHLAACRYRRQSLVCSQCRQAYERLGWPYDQRGMP